ncbi:MAG: S9 family peptidase, partial [Acidobacteriota bacterium]
TPYFSTVYAVWIEAGGGVAIPNLRGGGEYGREWHEAGMREKKQNVFDDFIAAAEWLIENHYTSQDRLAISGGSNGGLLVSAAVTQRPELFEAMLCQVPLTDMLRFHRFKLANIWTEEYGSPEDPEMFPHLAAYSPYHRVEQGVDYPAMLVTASVNDARVDPMHARKFAAAARFADEDHGTQEPILFHLQDESGHGGAVTIDAKADQVARHFAFLMQQLGMRPPV